MCLRCIKKLVKSTTGTEESVVQKAITNPETTYKRSLFVGGLEAQKESF